MDPINISAEQLERVRAILKPHVTGLTNEAPGESDSNGQLDQRAEDMRLVRWLTGNERQDEPFPGPDGR